MPIYKDTRLNGFEGRGYGRDSKYVGTISSGCVRMCVPVVFVHVTSSVCFFVSPGEREKREEGWEGEGERGRGGLCFEVVMTCNDHFYKEKYSSFLEF